MCPYKVSKISFIINQVTTGYCCEWLLCILGVLHGKPGYYMLLLLVYHVFHTYLLYLKKKLQIGRWILSVPQEQIQEKILFIVNMINTCYCCMILPCFLPLVVGQKRRSKLRAVFKEIFFQWKTWLIQIMLRKIYYRKWCLQLLLCMLPSITATNGMPKTEATNWRLIPKCTGHIGSRKIALTVSQGTFISGYYIFQAGSYKPLPV